MRTSPTAIGIEVVPTDIRSSSGTTPGTRKPSATPAPMARKIQSVKQRSRNESRRVRPSRAGATRVAASAMSSQAPDEGLEAAQRSGLHAVADARAVDVAADEAGLLQHLQVLRDGRL